MANVTAGNMSRNLIYKLAMGYIDPYMGYDVSDKLCEEYSISRKTLHKALERAVIEGVVEDQVVLMMASRAKSNAEIKVGKKGKKGVDRHYTRLIEQREQYELPKEEATQWAIKYSNSDLDKKEFCIQNRISIKLFGRTVYNAIVNGWVSDYTVSRLKNKSLKRFGDDKTKKFWEKIEEIRSENRNHE